MVPSWVRSSLAAFIVVALLGVAAVLLRFAPASTPDAEVTRSPAASAALSARTPSPTKGYLSNLAQAARVGRGVAIVVAPGPRNPERIDIPVVVVTAPGSGQHTILWNQDFQGRAQMLEPTEYVGRGTLHSPYSVISHAIQNQTVDGVRELGIVYNAAAFGSGSPTARLALLRLTEDAWQLLWDSGADEEWRGSHGTVEFSDGDLSEIVVRSDSWVDGYDQLSNVLHESNSGPHRYFVDTWVRNGDGYVRSSAETVPAPYATLVEFLYALGQGDDAGAQEWVTQAELVSRARSFGMDGDSRHWLITCPYGQECGVDEPIRFDPTQYHGEPAVAVYFEERDGQWLIRDIQPEGGS